MIYDILPVNNYRGNGSSTTFDFDFLIENKSQLKVTLFDANLAARELVCDVDYTINQLNNPNGSYINFPISGSKYPVLAHDEKISIELVLPVVQSTKFNNSTGNVFSEIEKSFDYLTRLVQIIKRKLSLCVNVSEGSDNTPQELMDMINHAHVSAQNYANISLSNSQLAQNFSDIANLASQKAQEYLIETTAVKNEIKTNGLYKYSLFDFVLKDHILEGNEAKGWALQGTYVAKALYPDFYNECLIQKSVALETEVMLGDNAITIFKHNNGHQFFNIADKAIIDAFFDTYGIADFYGIDEENERIFLPRNKYFAITGKVMGNGLTLGLTDGTTNVGLYNSGVEPNNMTFRTDVYNTLVGSAISTNGTASSTSLGLTTEPQKSGIILEPNENKYLYYCVGNTVVNDSEINAGAIVAQIERRANIELDNVSPSQDFVNQSIMWGTPDYSASTSISLTAGDTWVVPYDCELFLTQATGNGGGALKIRINNSSGPVIFWAGSSTEMSISTDRARFKKGTILYIERMSGTWTSKIIIPLIGANL